MCSHCHEDEITFNEEETKYLNQLSFSHPNGEVRYFNKHRKAPKCVLQFLRRTLDVQLLKVERHRNGTEACKMTESKMERVMKDALVAPYADLNRRARQLLKKGGKSTGKGESGTVASARSAVDRGASGKGAIRGASGKSVDRGSSGKRAIRGASGKGVDRGSSGKSATGGRASGGAVSDKALEGLSGLAGGSTSKKSALKDSAKRNSSK